MDALDFYDVTLPAAGLRVMALPQGSGFKHLFGDTNSWLADAAPYVDAKREINVYFACASYKDTSSRKQSNVAFVRSFWADIDCGLGKPYGSARGGAQAGLEFSQRLGLPRPYIVASGNGIHVYWPMSEDMTPEVWKATATLLKAALKAEGVFADPSRTADIASVLRPPGTHHRKGAPKLVRVVVEGEVSELAEFQAKLMPYAHLVQLPSELGQDFLPAGRPVAGMVMGNSDLTAGVEYRPSDGRKIAEQCGVIALLRDNKGVVDQPTWYFGMGVLAFTEDGDALCHEYSSGDPRYSEAETNKKIAQIRANQRPTSCEKLGEQHPIICAACPHNGKIKTPYALGLVSGETVQVVQQVRTATGWTTKIIEKSAPFGYNYQRVNGHMVMQHAVLQVIEATDETPAKKSKPETGWVFETFCETMVMPITRLWIEGVAFVECEMDLNDGATRRFLVEGGLIGKGKDTLAAELARNEVVVIPGKGNAMDAYMKTWMQKLKQEADQVVAHQHFGWVDRSFVLGDTVLHPDGSSTRAVLVKMAKSKAAAVSCAGTLEAWVDVVDRAYNAPGQEGYQFLVAASFAAPLLSMMNDVSGVTVYAHSEGSGVGKTTAQRVGLSAWGNWDQLMLADAKVTQNALWGLIGAYHSLPVVFDELTNTANNVCSELVFSVSSGRSKERMTADGGLNENNSNWATILLASGNNLLSEKLSLHRGNAEAEISRLFEFTLTSTPHLTPNEANALFPLTRLNYGHAGRVFAAYVVENYDLVSAMLATTQAKLNLQLDIQRVERYWSALLASTLVALALCRTLGLLKFEMQPLKAWMVERLAENRTGRNAAASEPLELFGSMLSDLWEGVLVTIGEGDLRKGVIATPIDNHRPRGALVGRAIVPAHKTEVAVLMLNAQAVKDWANKKGVSAREMFKCAVAAGWADPLEIRYSLGKGTVEYSQTSSYLRCWKLSPERIGMSAGTLVAQKLGVVNGGLDVAARGGGGH